MELKGRKHELPSGAKLYVNPATYEETEQFLGAFLEAVQGLPLDVGNDELVKNISHIAVGKVFINPSLKASMWKCLLHCHYIPKGKEAADKITPMLFDGIGSREDLADIFYECAFENFSPFLKGLYNVSIRLALAIKSTRKQS